MAVYGLHGRPGHHQKLVAHAASDHFFWASDVTHWQLDLICPSSKKGWLGYLLSNVGPIPAAARKTTASPLAMEKFNLLCTQTKPTYWSERSVLSHQSEHEQLRTGHCCPLKLRVSTHLGTKGSSHTEIAGERCGSQEKLQDAPIQEPKPGYPWETSRS